MSSRRLSVVFASVACVAWELWSVNQVQAADAPDPPGTGRNLTGLLLAAVVVLVAVPLLRVLSGRRIPTSHCVFAACCAVLAVHFYFDLVQFEQEGGHRRLQWLLALAYQSMGKWGVVGFFGVASVVALVAGYLGYDC